MSRISLNWNAATDVFPLPYQMKWSFEDLFIELLLKGWFVLLNFFCFWKILIINKLVTHAVGPVSPAASCSRFHPSPMRHRHQYLIGLMENQVSYIGHIIKRFILYKAISVCFCCSLYQWMVSGHHAKKEAGINYISWNQEIVNLDMHMLKKYT